MTFRLDKELKSQADIMFQSMGLTTGTAITMFLRRFVDTGEFPFTPGITDPFYLKENLVYIEERIESFKKGNRTEHDLIEVSE
ncbi:type II toxin-antitoxin system RelB/DinJ family antitoxin [Lactovum odontotermitis]